MYCWRGGVCMRQLLWNRVYRADDLPNDMRTVRKESLCCCVGYTGTQVRISCHKHICRIKNQCQFYQHEFVIL